jgi:pimeloyl-ACP methyl ester carboxylesterase
MHGIGPSNVSAFVRIMLGCAALSIGFAGLAQQRASPALDRAILPYASTENSARLPDGRTIHLVCMGRGSPVVVLTAGGSGWSVSWAKVQPAIATKTRVCSWDPAGLGLSSPSPEPQTSDNIASDLEAALKARGIDGPYVMVGHSLGAYPSLLLADRQPSKVVGMVLVDPALPDQMAIFDRITPAQSAYMRALPGPVPSLEKCAAALRSGSVHPGGPDPDGCLRAPDWPPSWPPEFRAALNKNYVGAAPGTTAAALSTLASNMKSGDENWGDPDSRIVINPARNYRDMPLIVLTASEFAAPSDYPAAAKAEIPAFQAEWRRGHDAYAALSTRGVNRIVPDSTHRMPDEKPGIVVGAIDEVVDAARGSTPGHR